MSTGTSTSSPHLAEAADLIAAGQRPRVLLPDTEQLLAVVGSTTQPLPERLGAGAVLGLVGDPRIDVVPALIDIPGGTVRIGLAADRVHAVAAQWRHVGVEPAWIAKEVPEHAARLDDFRIGRYPVTNSQYLAFLTASGHQSRPATWHLGAYPWDRANHPVAGLSVVDAEAYVRWLAEQTGLRFRLPTEVEWEYAAKGHDGREFPWGDRFDPTAANTRETGLHTTTPVGMFPRGRAPFGADDMAGNVEEYVADNYRPYAGGSHIDDDLVQRLGEYRVTRGGSFARFGDLARTRRRHGPHPGPLYPCGMRVACDVSGGHR